MKDSPDLANSFWVVSNERFLIRWNPLWFVSSEEPYEVMALKDGQRWEQGEIWTLDKDNGSDAYRHIQRGRDRQADAIIIGFYNN